jgi:tetratricopeptide (TPR) repeat protein
MKVIHSTLLPAALSSKDEVAEAHARLGIGAFSSSRGRNRSARSQLVRAREVFRRFGYARSEATVLLFLVSLYRVLGERSASEACSQDMLELSVRLADGRYAAYALHNLGMLAMDRRDLGVAQTRLEEAARIFAACSDRRGQSLMLLRLGVLHGLLGNDTEALASVQRCLALCRSHKNPAGEAHALLALHEIYLRGGARTEASRALALSLELFRATDQQLGEARALLRLGESEHDSGRHATAETVLRQALRRIVTTGARRWQARIHAALGDLLADVGRDAEARIEWEAALTIYVQIDAPDADDVRARFASNERAALCAGALPVEKAQR